MVPVDSTASEIPQYPSGVTGVATVTPDASSRDLLPWERQPHGATAVTMTNNNFASAANGMPASPHATPYNMNSQDVFPQNQTPSGMTAGSPNGPSQFDAGPYPNTNAMLHTPQPNQQYSTAASHPFADGWGAMPQQVSYRQVPVSHETAIAANTNQMPSYSQGQRQPQMNGYAQQNAPTQSPSGNFPYVSQTQQQTYQGNGTQYAAPGIGQSVPYSGTSNVPVVPSAQSYRDSAPQGMNQAGQFTPFPEQQPQIQIPYSNTPVAQKQDYYH